MFVECEQRFQIPQFVCYRLWTNAKPVGPTGGHVGAKNFARFHTPQLEGRRQPQGVSVQGHRLIRQGCGGAVAQIASQGTALAQQDANHVTLAVLRLYGNECKLSARATGQ